MNNEPSNPAADLNTAPQKRRNGLLVPGLGLLVIGALWFLREPLQEKVRTGGTLANDAPSREVVEEMITMATDTKTAVLAAWNSGKIVHREVAMALVARVFPGGAELPSDIEAMVLAGALDPDANVRESALETLRSRQHPATFPLALEQVRDPDQRVRLLGLNQLRSAPPEVGIHAVAALLDDPDLVVVGMSLKLMEIWSRQTFGSKLVDTVPVENQITGLQEFQTEGLAKVRAAANSAKAWWLAHRAEYPEPSRSSLARLTTRGSRVLAPDFELTDLEGRPVRLSGLRGKVVLINFWTTWCTACVGEIPALVALQKQYAGRNAILGVSLDYVPDSHGHIGGHAEGEEQAHSDGHHNDHEETVAALKRVREKVVRVAQQRGINYPVLLDEHNEVGGRYNGGELPTTVLVDAEGFVRRRFVGARSLKVFEAMIAEAATSLPAGASVENPPE
jgi:thiol-disulfide isomerase/thioredoxin